MLKKFSEAWQLFSANLALISAIVLTVWLPGNVLVGLLTRYLTLNRQTVYVIGRTSQLIEWIFGPLYVGALIYAFSRLKQGWTVSYGEAMRAGLRNWGKLFGAQLRADLLILLGLLALVVPGLILILRYLFLEHVVVLEGASSKRARSRSTHLTQHLRWRILGAWVIFIVCFAVVYAVLYSPIDLISSLNNFAINLFVDCLRSVLYSMFEVVLFLYYWEAVEQERAQFQNAVEEAVPTPPLTMQV